VDHHRFDFRHFRDRIGRAFLAHAAIHLLDERQRRFDVLRKDTCAESVTTIVGHRQVIGEFRRNPAGPTQQQAASLVGTLPPFTGLMKSGSLLGCHDDETTRLGYP